MPISYAHSYFTDGNNDVSVSGAYGSVFANTPFGAGITTSANHYGIETSYRFNPQFVLSGWVGYSQAIAEVSKYYSEM